ncbi:hypothetical protein ES708_05628 [subsurface metagenome]
MNRGQGNQLTVVATGDSMISKKVSVLKDDEFLSVIKIARNADVVFGSCESLFHNHDSFPMVARGFGVAMGAKPSMAQELKWVGFNLLSLSNTHSMDFGSYGMFSTMETLEKLDIVYAGVGKDLDEAGEPKYLETEKGRVALISSGADTILEGWQRATNARGGVVARPGENMLRLDTHYVVDKDSFKYLKDLQPKLNKMSGVIKAKDLEANELTFADREFREGDNIGVYRVPKKQDVERDLLSIKDARRQANLVFVSFHSHCGSANGLEYPDDFICEYAKACIDAGADAFLGHGPHILRGIEIYKGKPIFYSLGNFIVQNTTVTRVTSDQYEFWGLDEKARPSDFHDARWGVMPPDEPPYAEWWFESVVAELIFKQEELSSIKLYPFILGYGEPYASFGCPKIAKGEKARRIIEHLRDISTPWSTKIDWDEEIGIVRVPI